MFIDLNELNVNQSLLIVGIAIQSVISIPFFGIGFLLIAFIETLVLSFNFDIPTLRAFYLSLLVILISTVSGFIFGISFMAPIYICVLPIIIYIVWWFLLRRMIPVWISIWIVVTIIIITGYATLMAGKIIPYASNELFGVVCFFSGLLFSFGLSVFLHGISIMRFEKRHDIWKAVVIGNILIYLIPLTLAGIWIIPVFMAPNTF